MNGPVLSLLRQPLPAFEWNAGTQALLEGIAERAAPADAGTADLAADVAALRDAGILASLLPRRFGGHGLGLERATVLPAATLLRRIGRANLSVGRLLEGHMNAIKLIRLHAAPELQARAFSMVVGGSLLGVWAADGAVPVGAALTGAGSWQLSGAKRFASGLGLVDQALVTARLPDGGLQLCLLDVADRDRMDAAGWRTSGMRATVSGEYRLDGVTVPQERLVGAPGDYLREPHFEGGVWRYAALQVGAVEAIAEAARKAVAGRYAEGDCRQLDRVAELAALCGTARLWVESAALLVESPGAGEPAVAHALLARETVERCAQAAIAVADRALGAGSFFAGHPVERLRRDLAFFLRQANLDGKRDAAARTVVASRRPLGEQW